MCDMVSENAPAWLTILVILFALVVLVSWYSVYKWSEDGDLHGLPQTKSTQTARKTVNAAFVLRILVILFFDTSDDSSGAVVAQVLATIFFVGAIAAWAWFERERRKQPATGA
jgi:uncharacterized membrane protein YbjE (DUF340 family)